MNILRRLLLKHVEIIMFMTLMLVATMIRFYKLDSAPYGSLIDEASYGYIAHSIGQTGRDDLGNYLPLYFKAFGDYKLPLYGYLLVPFIKLFGLSNLIVRLPSALAGIGSTLLMYMLLKQLRFGWKTALIGAAIYTFSPWSIVLSRFGFESHVALLMFLASTFLFLNGLDRNKYLYFILSAICLGITWYSYVAYRLISVGFVITVGAHMFISKRMSIMQIGIYLFVFTITIFPLLSNLLSSSGAARFNQIGLSSNAAFVHVINEYRGACQLSWPQEVCRILANKPLTWVMYIVRNMTESLSPEFLFLSAEKSLLYLSVPSYGALAYIAFTFYISGITFVGIYFKKTVHVSVFILLLFWALLPAALVGIPQRVRLSAALPFFVFICVLGYQQILKFIGHVVCQRLFFLGVFISLMLSGFVFTISFVDIHVSRYTQEYAGPLRGAITKLADVPKSVDVYFASHMHNAITWYAYYLSVDPAMYQKNAWYSKLDGGGFSHPLGYKNIQMQQKSIDEIRCDQKNNQRDFIFVTDELLRTATPYGDSPIYSYLSLDRNSSLINMYYFSHHAKATCNK